MDGDKTGAPYWSSRISRALESESRKAWVKKIKSNRLYLSGEAHSDGADGLVRANLLYASMATMIPYVYARDPDVIVSPSKAARDSGYDSISTFAETLEIIVARSLKDARLKARVKNALRSEWACGFGAMKVLYQRDIERDPIIQNRIEDAQENIRRINHLVDDTEELSSADREAKLEELRLQISALEDQVEVVVAEGLVIDSIAPEDVLILDETIRVFDEYPSASAIAHRVWYEEEEYKESFGCDTPDAHLFESPEDIEHKRASSVGSMRYVAVWEIWDKRSNTVLTVPQGGTKYCREPFQPKKLGERWYPFFLLGFNCIDGSASPLAPVSLGLELQNEYNTTRTNYAEHRKESIPVRIIRSGGNLDEEDVSAIVNRKINQTIQIKGNPSIPISNDVAVLNNPPLDPAVYDTTAIRNEMDLIYGLSDASRSSLIQAKTATEAEAMREGMNARVSDRRDAMEDVITDMANYSAQILLQELSKEQVERIAGASSVWPQVYKPDIFSMVSVEIKSGSSGKPDKRGVQERWIQIVPIIKEMITEIHSLKASGQESLANAYRLLLQQTLDKWDDFRIDLSTYLDNGLQGALPAAFPQPAAIPQQNQEAFPVAQDTTPVQQTAPQIQYQQPAQSDGAAIGLLGSHLASLHAEIAKIREFMLEQKSEAPTVQPIVQQGDELFEIARTEDGALVGRKGNKVFRIARGDDGVLKGTINHLTV